MGILVTGANGFIGHHLVSSLTEDGAKVSAIVRKMPEQKNSLVDYYICDLAIPNWTDGLPIDCETIVHLAQSMRYREFPEGSKDMFDINIRSTFELLEWARKTGIKHFIHASTGNVYKPVDEILDEDTPCEPNSMYAATKLAAENLVQQYRSIFQTTILRIFGVYGPGQEKMVIPNIIASIKDKKKLTLANNIGLRFTPLHVSDMVKMIQKVIQHTHKPDINCFNVCGNETLTLREAIQMISKYLDMEVEIEVTEGKETCLVGSNQKFEKVYGFKPQIDFYNGLRDMFFESEI